MRNLLIFKMYLTDKEVREMPWSFYVFLGVVALILLLIAEVAK